MVTKTRPRKSVPRKLAVLCDGSSNNTANLDENSSTVLYKLNQAFSNGKAGEQISFYYSGVGTHRDKISGITGLGLNEIIRDAYINLSSNYLSTDLIYIFGFSRGAIAARCLAALISKVGLLKDGKLSAKFRDVWDIYENFGTSEAEAKLDALEGDLHETPKIRFLGVFDSVAGDDFEELGIMKLNYLKNLNEVPDAVDHAIHLLSVDDNRHPSFEPSLWWGNEDKSTKTIEQIWIPGVHADIGGCSDGVVIGNLAALTMLEKLKIHCSEFLLDMKFINHLEERTFSSAYTLRISNERPDAKRKALGMRLRSAAVEERTIVKSGRQRWNWIEKNKIQAKIILPGKDHKRHYLIQALAGRQLMVREDQGYRYCAKHITDQVKGPSDETCYKEQIDALVSKLLDHGACEGSCRVDDSTQSIPTD